MRAFKVPYPSFFVTRPSIVKVVTSSDECSTIRILCLKPAGAILPQPPRKVDVSGLRGRIAA